MVDEIVGDCHNPLPHLADGIEIHPEGGGLQHFFGGAVDMHEARAGAYPYVGTGYVEGDVVDFLLHGEGAVGECIDMGHVPVGIDDINNAISIGRDKHVGDRIVIAENHHAAVQVGQLHKGLESGCGIVSVVYENSPGRFIEKI